MTGEFEKQLRQMKLDNQVFEKIVEMIRVAGDEFPCLSCPSNADCSNFSWFIKWFREADNAR